MQPIKVCVIQQEFPSFELISCFGVFALSRDTTDDEHMDSLKINSFARLAKAFGVDHLQLMDDFRILMPLAHQTKFPTRL